MAKLSDMSLPDLYSKKMTSVVEKAILEKEDFSNKASLWCEKVCKLQCKNPPIKMFDSDYVDVLIIQDVSAMDEPKFRKKGAVIERKHLEIIRHIANRTLGYKDTRYSYAVTNLVKCQISGADIKKGKPPTETVLAKCKPYLLQEIATRKPRLIISLNKVVTGILGSKKSNAKECGSMFYYEGIPVVITLHPRILLMLRQNASGGLWGPDFYSVIERDFVKAAWMLRPENPLRIMDLDEAINQAKKRIFVARSLQDVKDFCEILVTYAETGSVLSFDTETNTLDPFSVDAKIICMQFGVRNVESGLVDAYVFPMWHKENHWYPSDKAWEEIRPILLEEKFKKIGHNIKFDCLMVEQTCGIRIKGILFDTMLMMHAINSGIQGLYGLKQAVGNWLPDSGLMGYEEHLPKLTKVKKNGNGTEDDSEEGEEGSSAET